MSTVIFKWNPAFSSQSMLQYLHSIVCLNEGIDMPFNWSVWDHHKIHKGDKYYWLKVGRYGQIGIVSSGTITCDPYQEEDWSGHGRETYYVDFTPKVMINPDALPILTAEELSKAIPDFEWTGGHSGLVLNNEQAKKLDELWKNMLETNTELIEKAQNLNRGDGDLVYIAEREDDSILI